MVAVVGLGISRAMMLFLQEVGADGLADESTLGNTPASDPKARRKVPESIPSCLFVQCKHHCLTTYKLFRGQGSGTSLVTNLHRLTIIITTCDLRLHHNSLRTPLSRDAVFIEQLAEEAKSG
jgi:hypothetical protein